MDSWQKAIGYIIITLLILTVLAVVFSNTVSAATECTFFEGDLINGITSPLPSTCVETEYALIKYICDGLISITAKVEDSYYIDDGDTFITVYLKENQTQLFNLSSFDVAQVWTSYGFSGLVDYVERDCTQEVIDPTQDGRTNYRWGDHKTVFYFVDGIVNFYNINDGVGNFSFAVSIDDVFPVCNVDNSTCVYYLEETKEYQVNIVDNDGKTFVIRSKDWTWNVLEFEVIEP